MLKIFLRTLSLLLIFFNATSFTMDTQKKFSKKYAGALLHAATEAYFNSFKDVCIELQNYNGSKRRIYSKEHLRKFSTYFNQLCKFDEISNDFEQTHKKFDLEKNKKFSVNSQKYIFEESVSDQVIQFLFSYFSTPQFSKYMEHFLDLTTNESTELWVLADRLGVRCLESRLGIAKSGVMYKISRDNDIWKQLHECIKDKKGTEVYSAKPFDRDAVQKILAQCFRGDEGLLQLFLERYCYNNPFYFDMDEKRVLQELPLSGNPDHIQASSTGTFVAVLVKSKRCFEIYKNEQGALNKLGVIELAPIDKGHCGSTLTFSPNDDYCVLLQQRGGWRSLNVYECKTWKMVGVVEFKDFKTDFVGFGKDAVLLHNWQNASELQWYDFQQNKIVQTCDISELKEYGNRLKKVMMLPSGRYVMLFDYAFVMNSNLDKKIEFDKLTFHTYQDSRALLNPRYGNSVDVMLTEDGKRLIVVSNLKDGCLEVWDIETEKCLEKYDFRKCFSTQSILVDQVKIVGQSSDSRYIMLHVEQILPNTKMSSELLMKKATFVWDCKKKTFVFDTADGVVVLGGKYCIRTVEYPGWFYSMYALRRYGVTLQSIVEKMFETVFKK